MKTIKCFCDRCGRDIPEGTPDAAELSYKSGRDSDTDHLCATCKGHYRVDFLTAKAARMGIKPKNIEPRREVGDNNDKTD